MWRGNTDNPVPNTKQEPPAVSEVKSTVNRAHEVRRDQDTQKNITFTLADIDETILRHVERLNLSVIDNGQVVKVPVYLASPDRWKSAQVDGYFRDYTGNMILPAMVFKRESTEKDESMRTFNRYMRYTTMRKYSQKNQYTPFTALMGQNAPINDVFEMVMPDHMLFTYKFLIWTEKVSQMNKLVEEINFAAEDYWGEKDKYKFRAKIDSFVHTVEVNAAESRIVRTEFSLLVNGYLLPPQFDGKAPTMKRYLTPKKIVMGMEVVRSNFDPAEFEKDREKWRNNQYPNLPHDEVIPPPPVSIWNDVTDGSSYNLGGDILDAFNKVKLSSNILDTGGSTASSGMAWKTVPASPNDFGEDGWMAYDSSYLYVYAGSKWRRVPINQFS
jgi:hypothetical protein